MQAQATEPSHDDGLTAIEICGELIMDWKVLPKPSDVPSAAPDHLSFCNLPRGVAGMLSFRAYRLRRLNERLHRARDDVVECTL